MFAAAKIDELNALISGGNQLASKARCAAGRSAAARRLELWSPFGKRLALAGIATPCGGFASDPGDMLGLLAVEWAPIFWQSPRCRC